MNHIIYGDNRISHLTKEEILNPFSILEIFNGKASDEDAQELCWTIFTAAMRPAYWMKFESPLYLYECFKQIIRLIDAGYLIMQIRPSYTQKVSIASAGLTAQNQTDDDLKESTIETQQEAYKSLIKVFSENGFFRVKIDLYDIVFEGLEPNCIEYYSSLHEFIYDTYQDVGKIIRSLYILFTNDAETNITERDVKVLEKYTGHDFDIDSPTFEYSDTIYDILEKGRMQ